MIAQVPIVIKMNITSKIILFVTLGLTFINNKKGDYKLKNKMRYIITSNTDFSITNTIIVTATITDTVTDRR